MAVVAHIFHYISQEAEAGKAQSSRTTWSRERVPGRPGYTEKQTLTRKTSKTNTFQSQNG